MRFLACGCGKDGVHLLDVWPEFRFTKITEDVRKYAAERGMDETAAPEAGTQVLAMSLRIREGKCISRKQKS